MFDIFMLNDYAILFIVFAWLVAIVNVLTQGLKKMLWKKFPTQLVAIVSAQVITLTAFFLYCKVKTLDINWMLIVATIVVGLLVAISAMTGFDCIKQIKDKFNEIKKLGGKEQ